jgi:RNA polymerase sigma factor (sigma-70 family)
MTNWNTMVQDEGPAVWRTLWRLLGNRADAEDCFQETFMAALVYSRDQQREVHNWSALLQKIATTRAVDRLRQRYRSRRRNGAALDPPDGDDIADATPSHRPGPVQHAIASELSEQLRRALCGLARQQAEAFCLHALSGWSYEEISRQTGMSSSAVGVNIHRARQQLRELLGKARTGEASEVCHD